MYDKTKSDINAALMEIQTAVDKVNVVLAGKVAVLNNATRLAVLSESLEEAKRRMANAKYDRAQTMAYTQPNNFSNADIAKLEDEVAALDRLVTSATFALKNER